MDIDYAYENGLLRSGRLGMCDDPYCTTCPAYLKASQQWNPEASGIFDPTFHSALSGDAEGCARRFISFLSSCVPGVMNPHNKVVLQWNKFVAIFCLVAIFMDPLFFLLLSVDTENNCTVINWKMTMTLVFFRTMYDFVYFLNILLQFRLASVAPESRVVGERNLVDHPTKIALRYLQGCFLVDLFVVFPLPQIIILFVLSNHVGSSGANYAKNLMSSAVIAQYVPRLCRFLPILIDQSPRGFMFGSACANFFINLLAFMLSGHVVGSCWYLFGLQRVNQCLRDACQRENFDNCMQLIDCGHGHRETNRSILWSHSDAARICLLEGGRFNYGIYAKAVTLAVEHGVIERYVYSLFWGFQQISILAGNLDPSFYVGEVLFSMAIIGMGLFLFMQNFLHALGRRTLEMSLRRRDVEQWMSHRRLPEELRRRVQLAEQYNWAATRGVNEEMLLENLPEDLQRDIRRHLFKFVKKVRIFALMDEPILDAICERLRQKTYIKGSNILYRGGLVDKMVFVMRGRLVSIGEDGIRVPLFEGDACGEELLTWCLSSVIEDDRKVRPPGQRLLSNRTVCCLTNVEAFSLRYADLEEVTSLFTRFLRNERIQGASDLSFHGSPLSFNLRYESRHWRSLAATRIQVAWRYRKKRLGRAGTSQSNQ